MKTRTYWLAAAFTIALLCAAGWTGSAQKQSRQPAQWEYMSIRSYEYPRFKGDDTLNELGAEGWELTSVAAFSPSDNTLGGTVFYFKRAKK